MHLVFESADYRNFYCPDSSPLYTLALALPHTLPQGIGQHQPHIEAALGKRCCGNAAQGVGLHALRNAAKATHALARHCIGHAELLLEKTAKLIEAIAKPK